MDNQNLLHQKNKNRKYPTNNIMNSSFKMILLKKDQCLPIIRLLKNYYNKIIQNQISHYFNNMFTIKLNINKIRLRLKINKTHSSFLLILLLLEIYHSPNIMQLVTLMNNSILLSKNLKKMLFKLPDLKVKELMKKNTLPLINQVLILT